MKAHMLFLYRYEELTQPSTKAIVSTILHYRNGTLPISLTIVCVRSIYLCNCTCYLIFPEVKKHYFIDAWELHSPNAYAFLIEMNDIALHHTYGCKETLQHLLCHYMSLKAKRLAIHTSLYQLDRKTFRTDEDMGTTYFRTSKLQNATTALLRFLKTTGLRGPSVTQCWEFP